MHITEDLDTEEIAALDDGRDEKKEKSGKIFGIFTPKKKKKKQKEEFSTLDSVRFVPIEVDQDDNEVWMGFERA